MVGVHVYVPTVPRYDGAKVLLKAIHRVKGNLQATVHQRAALLERRHLSRPEAKFCFIASVHQVTLSFSRMCADKVAL
jgi:hypothetical protein